MIKNWVIYKIVNPKGSVYIGRTCNFKLRILQYKYVNCKKQTKIYRSLKKYGYTAHKVEIIDSFVSDELYMKGKERFWIKSYMSNGNKYGNSGLNCSDGGDGISNKVHTEETRRKISETKRKNPKIYTEQMRAEISKRMKGHKYNKPGKKAPEGWVEKMRQLNTGKKYLLGRKLPKETIEKIAEKLRGRPRPEHMKKILLVNALKQIKPIKQFDLQGNFLAEYPSRAEAARRTGCVSGSIAHVLKGRRNQTKGFIFRYADGTPTEKKEPNPEQKVKKKLYQQKWYSKNREQLKAQYLRKKEALFDDK